MKKLFAILMSIMMIACFMPTMAFAEGTVSVNEVTVSGKKGSDIGNVTVTITLGDEGTFVETASMTGNWIQNLPSGLSQTVARGSSSENKKQATITITGAPTEVKEEQIQIKIPAADIDGQESELSIPQKDNVKFEILEEIEVPTVTPTTYDGTEKTALVDGTGYKVSDTVKATNVGTVAYTATVTLLPGYRWKDLDEGEKNKAQSVTWNLQKKNPEPADFTFKRAENLSYNGQTKTAELKLNSPYTECGDITLKYAKKTAENSYDVPIEQAPDAVGTYKVTAHVAGGDNFNPREVTDESWTFEITKAANQIAAPTPKGDLTYTGVAQDLVAKPEEVSCGCKVQYAVEKVTEAAAAAEKQWSEDIPQAKDAGKYNVYYKIVGCGNHEGVNETQVGSEPIVIKQKPVTYTIQVADKVYDGTNAAAIKADTTPETKDVAETDAEKVSLDLSKATVTFANANAEENKSVTVEGAVLTGYAAANYKLSAQPTATAMISKAPLTITDATIETKTYDNTTTATVSAVIFDGLKNDETLEVGGNKDYTVAGVFNDANVDKANSVTVTVTLISDKAKNYTIESFKKDAKIVPADKTDTTATVTVQKGTKGLVDLRGKIAEGATIGDITIQEGKAGWFAGDADAPKVVNGNLSFKLTNKAMTEEQNNTATLTIPVKGATNYNDYDIVVKVKASATEQEAVVIPPVAKTGLVYNGKDQPLVTAGEATNGEMQYSLTQDGTYSKDIPTRKNADRYTVYYKVVTDGTETVGEPGEATKVDVTIAQKPVTVQPKSFTIKQDDKLPTLVLEYVGLIGKDELIVGEAYQPTFKYMQGENDVTGEPKEVGTYTIKWINASAEKFTNTNYDVEVVDTATLTIEAKPPASSSGGSYYPYTPSTPSTPSAPNLDKTKTDSTTALNAAATANKYDAAEQAEVKKILDKANADIKNAKTEAEVKAIEEAAQAEIDKILTTEEKAIVAALDNVEKRDFATKSKVITRKGGKKVIRLTWTAPDGVDVDGYEIFRSTKKNSGFGKKPYFTTSNTSYTNTKDLKAGKTYYYKVRAFVVINGERVYTDYSLKAYRKL